MQHLTYAMSISPSHYYMKRPYQLSTSQSCLLINAQFRISTSFTLRPMTRVFGLGTRLHVRMRARLEIGIPPNGQHQVVL